jgi:hypothetical protein
MLSAVNTLRSVAEWLRTREAEPARRALDRLGAVHGSRFPDLRRQLESALPHPEVRQALKNRAESSDPDLRPVVSALIEHCGLFLPTDEDRTAANEALLFFLECCNEEILACQVHGAARHDSREERRAARTQDAIAAANEKLDELLLRIQPPTPDAALRELLVQSERENPGLVFSARTTAEGTMFEVSARHAGAPVHVGTLSFPPTEDGRRGREKFRRVVEEGRGAELGGSEAVWTPAYSLPGRELSTANRIVISPTIQSRIVPVKVEGPSGTVLVDYAELRLVRAGTKEQELTLGGGRLAGSAGFILRPSGKPSLWFQLSGTAVEAAAALRTVELFLHFVSRGRVRVVALETGSLLFEFTGQEDRGWADRLAGSRALLQDLALINERFRADLTFPEAADPDSEYYAHVLAEGIRRGRVVEVMTLTSTAKIERRGLQAIADQQPDAAIQVAITEPAHPFTLFGKTIRVPCRVVLEDPVRADFDRAAAQSAEANPEDLVEARVTWGRITYEFLEWADALRDKSGKA